jgi:hypothetical protein
MSMGTRANGADAREPLRRSHSTKVLGHLFAISALMLALVGAIAPTAVASASVSSSWVTTAAVLPEGISSTVSSDLTATSCPAPGECVAVGGDGGPGFIDTQSNGGWTVQAAPTPSNANASDPNVRLFGLSCVAVGWCTAVGNYRDIHSDTQSDLLTLANGSWTASEGPVPPDADGNPEVSVLSVSCGAPGSCAAVGSYATSGIDTRGLLLTLAHGTWSTREAPLPSDASPSSPDTRLQSVSCVGADWCEATGEYTSLANGSQGLTQTFTAGNWTASKIVLPADAAASPETTMASLSCPAVDVCTAVGSYLNGSDYEKGVIASVENGVSTSLAVKGPKDAIASDGTTALTAVSCPTTQSCIAVGDYVSTSNTGVGKTGFIDTFSGFAWTASTAPGDPSSGAMVDLNGVSCSWPGSCAAIGYTITTPSSEAEIETLTNGSWSSTTAKFPNNALVPNAGAFGLTSYNNNAVSCTAGTCAAVGAYRVAALTLNGMVATFPNLSGYQMVASDGGLFAFNTPFFGSMGGQPLNEPVVGMAVVPDSGGYYEVASDGGIFAFNAPFYGSMGGKPLNAPIVGLAFDSQTGGYYEVASDGGIFAFNAPFLGSMGGQPLNKPIVGIAFDSLTGGYYEVASDGGLFAFGAPFLGSTGAITLNKPVVGMTVDTTTGGYYEVASDGGLFAYGAPFLGSQGGSPINKPVVGMAFDYITGGYYEVASDGGIFAFSAPFQGSTGNLALNQPIVGMTFG